MNPDIQELAELEFDPYLALYNCCKLDSFVAVRRGLPCRTPKEHRTTGHDTDTRQAVWKTQFVTTVLVYSEQ